jgi:glycosyltransferase involved in cell wall biosynthesis
MSTKFILIISAVYPPEPVVSAKLSADLYQALKADGKLVIVLHPAPTRPNGFKFDELMAIIEDEVTLTSYTCPQSSLFGRFRESLSFGLNCAKYISEHHQEIAYIYANAWPLGSQFRIVKMAKKYGIPVAMHVQDVYPESLTNKLPSIAGSVLKALLLPIDKYILRNSNRVIAISEKMKAHLVKTRGIDASMVSVVINWQDETEFLEYQKGTEQDPHDKFTFMYMGNIGPVAGVDLLIDAFEQANLEGARLVIAGSGSMKESLKEKASPYTSIEFWDVPNGKVPEIQSKADVMLLPIKKGAASSSIPSKLPAYMFSAKPIIGSMDEDSDTANAISEAQCGAIVEPENARMLADVMARMAVTNRRELEAMGKKGQEYALAHFSKGANLNNLTKVIGELL